MCLKKKKPLVYDQTLFTVINIKHEEKKSSSRDVLRECEVHLFPRECEVHLFPRECEVHLFPRECEVHLSPCPAFWPTAFRSTFLIKYQEHSRTRLY